ncbi:MAG: iron-containing alcohol dehydrogenase [Coriobacteriia bacterium]|nr:iron-containing alcohol dehydrogenase [Coriobacteriia bacterium]
MIPDYHEFCNSTKIVSGNKAIEHIGYELAALGASKPLVLTNKQLLELKVATVVLDALKDTEAEVVAVYDDVPVDSSVKVVNDVARVYREIGADAIIAVGGGSVLDTAKGATIVLTHGAEDLMDYRGAESLLGRRAIAFIAIPTTAGTGSEVTSAAVIKDTERHVKMGFTALSLLPDVAILDPRMTTGLPLRLTASTAMDALTHAVEAFSCVQANPLSDGYARSAIDLIREYLPKVVADSKDPKTRLALANAALLAGVAFSNAMVGIVHAMGHAAGGVAGVPHGDAMAILLPHGMEFNLEVAGDRYGELLLNLAGAEVYASTPRDDRPAAAIEAVRAMMRTLHDQTGLPITLSGAGVQSEHVPQIAQAALNDGAISMNPRQPTYEELVELLTGAL